MPPVRGATWPILTSVAPAAGALPAPADLSALGASLLQPPSASATASSETASFMFFIEFSEGSGLSGAPILPLPLLGNRPRHPGYFCDRIHFTSALSAAPCTLGFICIG